MTALSLLLLSGITLAINAQHFNLTGVLVALLLLYHLIYSGTLCTFTSILSWFFAMYKIDSSWLANDRAITSGGWPSAATKLTTLPFDSKNNLLPLTSKRSIFGLICTGWQLLMS